MDDVKPQLTLFDRRLEECLPMPLVGRVRVLREALEDNPFPRRDLALRLCLSNPGVESCQQLYGLVRGEVNSHLCIPFLARCA